MIKRFLKNSRGFTLVELLLSVTIAGLILGVASETMMRQAETYDFIASRKNTVADLRFAMNRLSDELLLIETSDLQSISGSSISFTDQNGSQVSVSLVADGDGSDLYWGNDLLAEDVTSLSFEYQNGAGTTLEATEDSIEDVRRIKVTMTGGKGGSKDITMSTTVVPRSFIGYSNYQN